MVEGKKTSKSLGDVRVNKRGAAHLSSGGQSKQRAGNVAIRGCGARVYGHVGQVCSHPWRVWGESVVMWGNCVAIRNVWPC